MLLALSVKAGIDFEVAEFASGERLIAHYAAGEASFHILILDIEMDGLNGIQTARALIFEAKMLKLCRYFEERELDILIIKSAHEEIVLRQGDIIAIEAAKSLTVKSRLKFTTVDAVHDGKGLISSYASVLKNSKFLQIHRSILVNLRHVHKFAGRAGDVAKIVLASE